ncbi:MAG: hypothetical protein WCV72_01195 [Patescibacteria group bacterium]|jgi:hypothetical protein
MFSSCKKRIGSLLIVVVVLLVLCGYFSSLHTDLLATGLIDESLKEKLRARPYLTPQEYEEILQKIERVLEVNPDDLSANLLKVQLETTPLQR